MNKQHSCNMLAWGSIAASKFALFHIASLRAQRCLAYKGGI